MQAISNEQCDFIKREVHQLTVQASFSRVRIYAAGVDEDERKPVRQGLIEKLEKLAVKYVAHTIPEADHVRNISLLAKNMTRKYGNTLYEGEFRIGIAQKALNVFLKYLWCMGKIVEPPHCPFDRTVIQELRGFTEVSWSKIRKIEAYKDLVEAAKEEAGDLSLTEWELELFNNRKT